MKVHKRQHSIGGYILDFYCPEQRLIVELDGPYHELPEQKEYDAIRDRFFIELDYRVLRFANAEVQSKMWKVIKQIRAAIIPSLVREEGGREAPEE